MEEIDNGLLNEHAEKILTGDYINIEIVDRKTQIEELRREFIAPLLNHQTLPKTIYIYGNTGSGKTFLIKNLEKEIMKANPVFSEFFYIYYNASDMKGSKLYLILYEVLNRLRKFFPFYDKETEEKNKEYKKDKKEKKVENKIHFPKRGVPFTEMVRAFDKVVEKFKPTIVLVIDEIDKVSDYMDVIKWFIDKRNEYTDYWGITTIFISNDPYFLERVKHEIKSRIAYSIHFTPYTVEDFYEIAKVFISKTFKKPIDDRLIIKLAKKVNEISNSVRDLKLALYFFGKEGSATEDAINLAIDRSQMEIFRNEILSRPIQQKLVLYSIASFHRKMAQYEERKLLKGTLMKYTILPTIKNIFNEYKKIATTLSRINPFCEPRSYTTFFNIVKSLEDAQLVSTEVKSLGKGKGRTSFIYPKNASWEYYIKTLENEFYA